jgi:hypothetical protein
VQLYSTEIEIGMSGAPVLDVESQRVVGFVSERWMSREGNNSLAFATPIDSAVKVCPVLEEKKRRAFWAC